MTADLTAADRAYIRLKSGILRGELNRVPLDIKKLGDRFRMSATPVREALHRLCAERLVRHDSHGYAIVRLSGHRLQHLYEISSAITELSIDAARRAGWQPPTLHLYATVSGYADGLSALLGDIAEHQRNLELISYVSGISDRLFAARRAELKVFPYAQADLDRMRLMWGVREFDHLSEALREYHRSRGEQTDALARILAEEAEDA